jgi:hypothetical protein
VEEVGEGEVNVEEARLCGREEETEEEMREAILQESQNQFPLNLLPLSSTHPTPVATPGPTSASSWASPEEEEGDDTKEWADYY